MNEMMQFMEELKELCHKGEQIAQKMHGESYGQRRYGRYGMRDDYGGQSGSYGGGSYGQRWDDSPMMQGGYPPMQGGYQSQYPNVNPMMFM